MSFLAGTGNLKHKNQAVSSDEVISIFRNEIWIYFYIFNRFSSQEPEGVIYQVEKIVDSMR